VKPHGRQGPKDRSHAITGENRRKNPARPLYSPAELARRDASRWTAVQGVLAIVQFAVFLVSAVLVLRYLASGHGQLAATLSVVAKTLTLYAIMVTGSIWEKDVFGRYLFARPFFWEDVLSLLVMALHTAYLVVLAFGWLTTRAQFFLALTAYLVYVVNAGQFLFKLRLARLQRPPPYAVAAGATGAAR
jgi:3-vinyl bacteriochlorophyllide hydratase